jgi:hypothetical protein
VTINVLPDEVLLLIFHFDRVIYYEDGNLRLDPSWQWHRLVHVCQKWRSVVFGSPNFLDLTLVCHPTTPMELTGIWPPFLIIIADVLDRYISEDYDFDAAIAYHNRLCEINLIQLERVQLQRLASAMMQVQFPALIHLSLELDSRAYLGPALPDEFLSGSVPCLQSLQLHSIKFPGLPKLLLSVTHLVSLALFNIPNAGYFSPEAIVTGLAVLANLKFLIIDFGFEFEYLLYRFDPEPRRLPLPTRTVLPALTHFEFQGTGQYLDDLVARIDAPLLDFISITFIHGLIFDTPQLTRFMRRTTRIQALNETHVHFYYDSDFSRCGVQVEPFPPTRTFDRKSRLKVIYKESDGLLSSLAQICTSFIPPISIVEHLYIYGLPEWRDNAEELQWLDIFHPFKAAKNLYVTQRFARFIALALQDLVGERVTCVLPALESIFLEGFYPLGPIGLSIRPFFVARQLIGHPVAVSRWER